MLRISNSAQNMPLDFEIPRVRKGAEQFMAVVKFSHTFVNQVPHMAVHPMKGKLGPNENTSVVVSFTPKAGGLPCRESGQHKTGWSFDVIR